MGEKTVLYITEDIGETSFEIDTELLANLVELHYRKSLSEFMESYDSCDAEEIRAWMSLPQALSLDEVRKVLEMLRAALGFINLYCLDCGRCGDADEGERCPIQCAYEAIADVVRWGCGKNAPVFGRE